MADTDGFVTRMDRGSLRDITENPIQFRGGEKINAEFQKIAKTLDPDERDFMKRYADKSMGSRYDEWGSTASLEKIDERYSRNDPTLHPSVKTAFEDVLKYPRSYNLSVEENNVFEKHVMRQGDHDFQQQGPTPTSMLGGVRG